MAKAFSKWERGRFAPHLDFITFFLTVEFQSPKTKYSHMVLVTEHIFTRYCMLEVLYSGHYASAQLKGISPLYSLRRELNGLGTIGTVISEPGKTDLTLSGKIV